MFQCGDRTVRSSYTSNRRLTRRVEKFQDNLTLHLMESMGTLVNSVETTAGWEAVDRKRLSTVRGCRQRDIVDSARLSTL